MDRPKSAALSMIEFEMIFLSNFDAARFHCEESISIARWRSRNGKSDLHKERRCCICLRCSVAIGSA